jgi:hypothetical protein
MTHTPGPWVAECPMDDKSDLATIAHCGEWRIGFHTGVPGGNYRDGLHGSDEADARLIAASAELLEACEAMIEWDDREHDFAVDFSARMALCKRAFDLARAAIAKARGEP